MKRLRVYIDTSVVGGVFDAEFSDVTRAFFEFARAGGLTLLISDLLIEEIEEAPQQVREFVTSIPASSIEPLARDAESRALRDAYLHASVVGPASMDDAFHVALATIAKADLIVSWNFKHFVHIEKVRNFNAVNLQNGYGLIDIRSPREVAPHEQE